MILIKFVLKIMGIILLASGIFFAGAVFGGFKTNRQWTNSREAEREMAVYLYKEFKENFGTVNLENKNEYNIIGGFPLYKESGFAVILENGVKTIRVYE
jgi:hypothetical protein